MSDASPYPAHPRTPYAPLIVNAALTGMVAQRERVPNVPLTAAEIADDAQRCFDARATIVHLHARDDQARPQWRRDGYAELKIFDLGMAQLARRLVARELIARPPESRPRTAVARSRRDRVTMSGRARPRVRPRQRHEGLSVSG